MFICNICKKLYATCPQMCKKIQYSFIFETRERNYLSDYKKIGNLSEKLSAHKAI